MILPTSCSTLQISFFCSDMPLFPASCAGIHLNQSEFLSVIVNIIFGIYIFQITTGSMYFSFCYLEISNTSSRVVFWIIYDMNLFPSACPWEQFSFCTAAENSEKLLSGSQSKILKLFAHFYGLSVLLFKFILPKKIEFELWYVFWVNRIMVCHNIKY